MHILQSRPAIGADVVDPHANVVDFNLQLSVEVFWLARLRHATIHCADGFFVACQLAMAARELFADPLPDRRERNFRRRQDQPVVDYNPTRTSASFRLWMTNSIFAACVGPSARWSWIGRQSTARPRPFVGAGCRHREGMRPVSEARGEKGFTSS